MKKIVFCLTILILIFSCSPKQEAEIGVVVSLSGNYSPLLVSSYNGALLAAEQITENGNVKIMLMAEDDESDAELTADKVEDLYKNGIKLFVMSVTSNNYGAAESLINEQDVLVFSPTVSSSVFNRIEDNLIRMTPDIYGYAQKLAWYSLESGKRRLSIVYDFNNALYADSIINSFKQVFSASSDSVNTNYIGFDSTENPSFKTIGAQIEEHGSDAVMVIASPFDAALICQHLKDDDVLKLLAPWAVSDELIKNGGKAVEGVVFYNADESLKTSERYKEFYDLYLERFGTEPTYQSMRNYDTVYYIAELISRAGSTEPSALKQAINSSLPYQGVVFEYDIDEYGDCSHPLVPFTIRGGKIENLNT